MRAHFIALILLALLAAGCTSNAPSHVTRDQLDLAVVSSINSVNASAAGDVKLVGTNGIRFDGDAATNSVRASLGPLVQTNGAFIACGTGCNTTDARTGMIVADGSLISHNDVALNSAGPDRDSVVYFYDQGRQNGEYLRWHDAADRFEVSHNTLVAGELLIAGGPVGTVTPANLTNASYVYTSALEGNDVAIYLRGSGTLVNGTAVITFPASFSAIVGTGDITAQVTLTSKGPTLFVSEKAKDHIKVEAVSANTGSVTFDYFVQAPRVGGEGFHTLR